MSDPKSVGLWREDAFIEGVWTGADERFEVDNPANGSIIASVANCSPDQVEMAIQAADRALPDWRAMTGKERGKILRRLFELVTENREALGTLLSLEQGKPLREAISEIDYGAAFLEWFSEEAKRVYGNVIPGFQRDRRIVVLKQPVGVVAAITPWNFPFAMITRKVGPALAAGCTIVVKPASQTPLSALALAALGEKAGLPAGVLNVVPSRHSAEVGRVLTNSPLVRKVTFTGSTETGKLLLRQSASTVKKVSMELGGNAPVLVFDEADIYQAVAGVLAAKYRNSGQTCVCANRVFVQSGIHDAFVERLADEARRLTAGAALEGDFDLGPLIDSKALAKVEELVADALEKGGRLVAGGRRHDKGGHFYQPTVITGAHPGMALAREEIFGPVAPVFRFDTEAEAIALANATEFGLAAYFFSRDVDRIWRVAEAIEAGMVGINTGLISTEVAPFGGIKQSGLGREGSFLGIEDYVESKYLCFSVAESPT